MSNPNETLIIAHRFEQEEPSTRHVPGLALALANADTVSTDSISVTALEQMLEAAMANNQPHATIGLGTVAVGTSMHPGAKDGSLIYLQLPDARGHNTDCGDLFPVGLELHGSDPRILARINFLNAEVIDQTIGTLLQLRNDIKPFVLDVPTEAATDAEINALKAAIRNDDPLPPDTVQRVLQRLEEAEEEAEQDPATALIGFILEHANGPEGFDPIYLMETWNEGNFEALRRDWPELPEEVYIGADPLHKKTVLRSQPAVRVEPTVDASRYKEAWDLFYRNLEWMQEKGQTPAKYLGWNLAEALTAMYREAQAELAKLKQPAQGRKLHLVWNKPRNECVGFIDYPDARHAATGEEPEGFESTLAIAWLDIYGEDGPLHMETVLVKEKDDVKPA